MSRPRLRMPVIMDNSLENSISFCTSGGRMERIAPCKARSGVWHGGR